MKKQLDLTQMGLIEMNSDEMEQVDGGGLFGAIIGAVVGAVVGLIIGASSDNSIEGVSSSSWLTYAISGAMLGAAAPL